MEKEEIKKTSKDEKVEIEDEFGEEEETLPYKYSITSYGADYTIDSLVKRLKEGTIFAPPFQRDFVWTLRQASRFIESLLLGLPVPGIFLSKEQKTQKLLVIDGQQRLRTLYYFYEGIFDKTKCQFALTGVQSEFNGLTYKSLKDKDRRRLDDSILHATIVKQDEPSDDQSSIYHIFERLNTGGSQLQPQEIRTCIYNGKFVDLLGKLNQNSAWRSTFGKIHSRMRDRELILRFLALYFNLGAYKKPMKGFLNTFMGKNRDLLRLTEAKISNVFTSTIETIYTNLGADVFKPKGRFMAALFDALMVGVAKRLSTGEIKELKGFIAQYDALLKNETFNYAINEHTSDEDKVKTRMQITIDNFAKLE
jgi:uncharacterized protein with ParB-like and HNH nuclease domain